MPAFMAHLLIAKELYDLPENKTAAPHGNYFLLGSIGPDLPYYRNVFGSAVGTFFEEKFNIDSPGYYALGDYFHARTPNLYPLKLLEIIKKDKDPKTQGQKISFVPGYLTHLAADQTIHPFVEGYAGAYFVSGKARKEHRLLEVYQDLLLLEKKFSPNEFETIDLAAWLDISPPKTGSSVNDELPEFEKDKFAAERRIFTEEWFRSFCQRAFLEAYSHLLEGEEFEKWVRGFRSVLDIYKKIGPYSEAFDALGKNTDPAKKYREMFEKDYLKNYFNPAKDLAALYLQVALAFFNSPQVTEKERGDFLTQIPDIDLSSPLAKVIIPKKTRKRGK